ncbi:50S ribosomal protein L21 [Candidatus Nomurabacteria bacterium]|nr:50S ribosomal protein L21 [Candidatus Nomurabacteria bacterium]
MKLAVIKTGGKQYVVTPGTKLKVEKLPETKGGEVIFDQVLLTDDGKETKVGKPLIEGAKVTAKRLADDRHEKVVIVKYKNKTRYRVKRGHRQPFTEVEITGGF